MHTLNDLGTQTCGIWTRTDALWCLGRGEIQSRLRSGTWRRLFEGVYCDGGYDLSAEQWAVAAVMTSDAGHPLGEDLVGPTVPVAAGRSAARLWQLPLIDDLDPTTQATEHLMHDVITHSRRNPSRKPSAGPYPPKPGAHRVTRYAFDLTAAEVLRRPSGLWVTTPTRTALDCCLLLSFEAAVCLLDQGLRAQLFSVSDLLAGTSARAGSRGIETIRRAVRLADGRSESPAETLARLLLLPWLPDLVPQVLLRDEQGERVARFDLADAAVKLAVESDGKRGHEGRQMVAKDRRRDRRTEELGWITERVTWFELRREPEAFVTRIRSRHARLMARAA